MRASERREFIRRVRPQCRFCGSCALRLVKSSCHSPNFIEQTAHCDHKPRAAWVYVRLLLHWRSAAGWAECIIHSALVSFSSPCVLLEGCGRMRFPHIIQ